MKCAILAGGVGSRMYPDTEVLPKPMITIGGRPILWHIMQHYAAHGHRDFVIALGHLGHILREWVEHSDEIPDEWSIELVETGDETLTGGRIKQLAPVLGNQTFLLTWGDGVTDLDINATIDFHRSHGRLATLTAVHPPARFGHLELEGDCVAEFSEKPQTQEGWINGAFFVLEPGIFDLIEGDQTQWEREPMETLAQTGQLRAWRHEGFWQCMDTPRDRVLLENLWESGDAPWIRK